MNSTIRSLREFLIKSTVKLALDDDNRDLVNKRRFLSKKYYLSRSYSRFSSECMVDLSPDGRDVFGVNKEECSVSKYGHDMNRMSLRFK